MAEFRLDSSLTGQGANPSRIPRLGDWQAVELDSVTHSLAFGTAYQTAQVGNHSFRPSPVLPTLDRRMTLLFVGLQRARCHCCCLQNAWGSSATQQILRWTSDNLRVVLRDRGYGSQFHRQFHILRCPDPLSLLEERCSMKVYFCLVQVERWLNNRDLPLVNARSFSRVNT